MAHVAMLLDVVGDRRGSAGNARLLLELVAGLRERGHEVTLVCHEFDASGNFEQLHGQLEVRTVHAGNLPRPRGTRAILQRYRTGMARMAELVPPTADVINAHDWPALHAGALASRRLGLPYVWTRNDDTFWERAVIPDRTARGDRRARPRLRAGAFGLLDLRDARRAREIVVLSDYDAAMARIAYRRPVSVIRIGCAESFFTPPGREAARAAAGIAPGERLVLALALLVPHRRFEDLIDAFARLPDPAPRGLIVGSDHIDPGYADALAQRIAQRGLAERVELRRRAISDAELRGLYAAADVYVFPSSRQSYGQAPLEALASGTPVVVSTGAGVHEVLAGRPGVAVVQPGRPDELAAAITAQLDAPRDRLEPTRRWLRTELTNGRYAEAMEAVLTRALRR